MTALLIVLALVAYLLVGGVIIRCVGIVMDDPCPQDDLLFMVALWPFIVVLAALAGVLCAVFWLAGGRP